VARRARRPPLGALRPSAQQPSSPTHGTPAVPHGRGAADEIALEDRAGLTWPATCGGVAGRPQRSSPDGHGGASVSRTLSRSAQIGHAGEHLRPRKSAPARPGNQESLTHNPVGPRFEFCGKEHGAVLTDASADETASRAGVDLAGPRV